MKNIKIIPEYCKTQPLGFYVYLHIREVDNKIFYVGKGKEYRGWSRCKRSPRWYNNAIYGVKIEIVQHEMSEEDSLFLESWLIAKLRNEGHQLVNATDGGRGSKYMNQSGRNRISEANRKPVKCSNGMVFERMKDAAEWLRMSGFPKAKSSSISDYLNNRGGVRKSCYGFQWSWGDSEIEPRGVAMSAPIPIKTSRFGSFPSIISAVSHIRHELGIPIRYAGIRRALKSGEIYAGSHWSID